MSAPEMRATATQQSERPAHWSQYAQEMHFKLHRVNSCRSTLAATGVMQTFPKPVAAYLFYFNKFNA